MVSKGYRYMFKKLCYTLNHFTNGGYCVSTMLNRLMFVRTFSSLSNVQRRQIRLVERLGVSYFFQQNKNINDVAGKCSFISAEDYYFFLIVAFLQLKQCQAPFYLLLLSLKSQRHFASVVCKQCHFQFQSKSQITYWQMRCHCAKFDSKVILVFQ